MPAVSPQGQEGPVEEEADVVVLGMGPAGEEVAGRLAVTGLDVVGVEPELVGGECPYWGCVPTKLMVRASDAVAEADRASTLAGTVTSGIRYEPVRPSSGTFRPPGNG